ncbi:MULTISPECIES: MarR family winged helix-turn-helix transcriptional regulator [unclassified Streptomyces]|uniref:MarR family winged helix-turn-helix transcriptional regulator n=1 Tax=Streptomycetaceae TaxID=2062 RepID=UPI002E7891D7|nr:MULTISPECIES: MarR family winged helix-turn-helix transcriptional regulator [unclassified Streptomyces]MED7950346.1 MarR family winged helix-turn-helix transcriptional regulator [Streptomyces sp. BE303]MEE1828587.1 MarR family winged helix-turn-helix transcriptional regulator [Streptomyces sp. BE20]
MSTEQVSDASSAHGLSTDEAIRAMLLLMPRVAARLKRTPVPDRLQSMNLAPRHLSMLSYLLFDGPMPVNQLAARLEVAPTTVSLMVSDLTRQGVVERLADPADRRRTIVSITEEPATREAIERWLANGADAWRRAFEPLAPEDRALFVRTIEAYENGASRPRP